MLFFIYIILFNTDLSLHFKVKIIKEIHSEGQLSIHEYKSIKKALRKHKEN